jgi:hypothetical protein
MKYKFRTLSRNNSSRYSILAHWEGADFEVVVVKFMTVFVARRDSAYS